MPDGRPDHIQCNSEGPEPDRQVREEVCSCWLSVELTTKTYFLLKCWLILCPNYLKHWSMQLYCGDTWAERLPILPHQGQLVTNEFVGATAVGKYLPRDLIFSHLQRKCSHLGCAGTRSFPCHQLLGEQARAKWQNVARHATHWPKSTAKVEWPRSSGWNTCIVHKLFSSLLCCSAFSTDVFIQTAAI